MFPDIKAQVNSIIDAVAADREANRVALISFNAGASTLAGFKTLTAGNVTTLHNAVNGVTTSGTTMADWSAGLGAAKALGFDRESKRLVFFITGSNPSNTNGTKTNTRNDGVASSAKSSATALKNDGATVYAVWFGGTPETATAGDLNGIAGDRDGIGSYDSGPVSIPF